MTRLDFVYLVFGDSLLYHRQTYFSILTVMNHKRDTDRVIVYTDNPSYYRRMDECIEVRVLSQRDIDQWIDGTGYIFRAKIKAMEDCAMREEDAHFMFLDSDTCLSDCIEPIASLLDSGIGIMHKDEGHPSRMKGASLRMWNAVKGKNIGGCTISMRHNVWNSGVIGIPSGKAVEVCRLALNICDKILRSGAKCFTAEQYAFAVAMQEKGEVRAAEPWVVHYWGNKDEWQEHIDEFIIKAHIKNMTLAEEIASSSSFPSASLPVFIKKSNTQRRLVKLVKSMFKDKVQQR